MKMLLVSSAVFGLLVTCVLSQSCSLDPDGEAERVEVLVLGGGMAGIAAARSLEVNGITSFLVLEATDRIGGRIREYDGTSIELGANWIQGIDLEAKELHPIWREWVECDEDGPDGSPTPDLTYVFDENGMEINITEYEDLSEEFYTVCEEAEELGETLSEAISLREGFQEVGWDPENPLENFTEWINVDLCAAIKPDRISLELFYTDGTYTDFLGPEEDAEGEDFLVTDDKGYSFVVECMARGFEDRVKLNSVITTIQTAEDCVCVTVDDSKGYCGDYAIATFSIGVLQAAVQEYDDSILTFDPPLPKEKQDAINSVTLVHYGKIFLIFDNPFWNVTDEDQQVLGYVSEQRGEYPYYILDKNRPNAILLSVAEDLAVKVQNQPIADTVNEIMSILRKIYGNDIPDPTQTIISNWTIDPFFRSAWTAFAPEVSIDIFDRLLEPVDRLYFAGESLNETHYGFIPGAYGSGISVAEEVSSVMRKSSTKVPISSMTIIVLAAMLTLLFL